MARPVARPHRLLVPSTCRRPAAAVAAVRWVSISATAASSDRPSLDRKAHDDPSASPPSPDRHFSADARFEVVGSPFSLLSVSLSPSQNLYTRRGTLVGLSGQAENAVSTLSFLEPFRRAPAGIPFLYQKVSSTSPVTVLVAAKSPISSLVTVNLDGRQDWLIAQRQAILAWTGHTLRLTPRYNVKLGVANWGNTHVTGRGILALAGSGQVYRMQLKAGESYIAHPSNIMAYTAPTTAPAPFRFKSSNLRFQIPDLGFGSFLQNVNLFKVMSRTSTWSALASVSHTLRSWWRRTILGDRLFLRFEGPTTMLLQSRATRVRDVLTLRDVDDIAASPPGAVQDAVARRSREEGPSNPASPFPIASPEAGATKSKA